MDYSRTNSIDPDRDGLMGNGSSVRGSQEDNVHPALLNTLILSKVFGYLQTYSRKPSSEELKKCRLVCKAWSHEASILLGKQQHLVVWNGFPSVRNGQIDPALVRNVKIHDRMNVIPNSQWPLDNESFFAFWTKYKDVIEGMLFTGKYFPGPGLKEMFQTPAFAFSKLKELSINIDTDYDHDLSDYIPADGSFIVPMIPTLKMIHIHTGIGDYHGGKSEQHPFTLPLQEFITKSPNLENLQIFGNMYPDLSSVSGLKTLFWDGCPVEMKNGRLVIRKDFSLERLVQMLAQVSGSLEECELSVSNHDAVECDGDPCEDHEIGFYRINPKHFNLPGLPKVTTLTINPVNGFTCKVGMLTQANFPALKTLKLHDKPNEGSPLTCMDKLLKKEMGVWNTVEHLSLHPISYRGAAAMTTLHTIKEKFPNMRRLTVTLGLSDSMAVFGNRKPENSKYFCNWMKELGTVCQSGWNLEKLTVDFERQVDLIGIMDGIGGAGFKGLKSLKLLARALVGYDAGEVCNGDKYEPAILSIPKITLAGFHNINANAKSNMLNFAKANNRKLRFCSFWE